jgi:hypothetical protein
LVPESNRKRTKNRGPLAGRLPPSRISCLRGPIKTSLFCRGGARPLSSP